jgi:AmmeMemoRadiSam system protein A
MAPPGFPSAASLELNALERRSLLRAAREAIAARLASQEAALPPLEGGLAAARGAFVTLRRASDGGLRGCVGYLEADAPLLVTVTNMAVAAALRDRRFDPVTAGELVSLRIEISVLSPLEPIRPSDVQVGRHGLLRRSDEGDLSALLERRQGLSPAGPEADVVAEHQRVGYAPYEDRRAIRRDVERDDSTPASRRGHRLGWIETQLRR